MNSALAGGLARVRRSPGAALAFCLVAGLLWFFYRQTEMFLPEEATAYRYQLRSVLEVNAKLDSEVLASRLHLSHSYDALTVHQQEQLFASGSLLNPPSFLFSRDKEAVRDQARKLLESVRRKSDLANTFKARHSINQSSHAFFVRSANNLLMVESSVPELLLLDAYVRSMILYLGESSPDNLARLNESRTVVDNIDEEALPFSGDQQQAIRDLLVHGRLLRQNTEQVNAAVREFLSVPVVEEQEELAMLVSHSIESVERTTFYYRIVLYVCFAMVAGYLILTFVRLADARTRLMGSNSELRRRYTLQKQAEELLRLHEIAFNSAQEGIVLTDENRKIKVVNPAFERITGFSLAEVLGKDPSILKSGRQDESFYKRMWGAIEREDRWRGEIWNRSKDGRIYPEMLSITAVRNAEGRLTNYVSVFSDIGHIKRHETELRKMAHFDSLTGLPNRVLLGQRIQWAMANSRRHQTHLAVCYLDLDGFKPVNDELGHEAGDQLLIQLASRFSDTLRGDDTVARIGGDEFVFLFMDLSSKEQAQLAVSRLLQIVMQPMVIRGEEVSVSASVGVALYPDNGVDADTLIRYADQAMYESKQKGRNCSSFFDPDKDDLTRNAHSQQNEIRRALQGNEFVLHYQPKVNIRTQAIEGLEALIRWQHPEKGLLMPIAFLPATEGSDLTVDIGHWVIAEALSQMSVWQELGISIQVSVNVSAEHLQESDFSKKLAAQLDYYHKVPACNLQLEILETTALEDINSVSQIIRECGELGVSVALDDFGTGYSSLTYLKRLPASYLKIDRSFVQDIILDPESLALVRGILGLSRAFSKDVIAEGVESVEHGELLFKLGCDRMQGYAIAKAMPASEVSGWLQSWQMPGSWQQISSLHWDDEDYLLISAGIEHRRWVTSMLDKLKRRQPIPHVNFADHHECNFGQWYYASGTLDKYGQYDWYKAIEEHHKEIHDLAVKIDLLYRNQQWDDVQYWAEQLKLCGDRVVEELNSIERQVAKT